MENTFHKNKIYRVKEKTNRQGDVKYVVEAADSFIQSIFGIWIEYTKENDTLEDAIEQIEFVDKYKLKKEQIVHKETRQ